MDSFLTVEQIKILNNNIQFKYNEISELKRIMDIKYDEINKIKDYLINFCNHEKHIDSSSKGEYTEYYCGICLMEF